ncbi:hypothetical protein [Williamsia sp. D3]|uniref:hypothetical protein n=1 Tax=Williamsia sp. D3 TaxID=1313067 RepID=UPI0003D38231|nr:hypothetical protein [Williamsia sp. D3]ETD31240.1 hypothetical protein W823_19140 [Williamsia sp. D3]
MSAQDAFIPNPRSITRCRGCKARIFFVSTDRSEKMPVDVAPVPDGNLAITEAPPTRGRDGPLPTAVVLRKGQALGMRYAGLPVYQAHFRNCPNADEFRKAARSRRK